MCEDDDDGNESTNKTQNIIDFCFNLTHENMLLYETSFVSMWYERVYNRTR